MGVKVPSLFSARIGPDAESYPLSGLAFLANLGLGILLLVRRHKIGVAVPGQRGATG